MALTSALVGHVTGAFKHRLDARWSMAYAAALGDLLPAYFDTVDGRPIVAHPLFPVCLEWPALVASLRGNGVDMRRTVHATHDLHVLQPLAPDTELTTRATIVGVEQRKPGIYLGWRIDTTDEDGTLVSRTWQGNLFLGERLDGDPVWSEPMPPTPGQVTGEAVSGEFALEVPANLAHTYTECARIWNPIHTDAGVAAAAGIGRPLLHGTATLALGVSAIVAHVLDGQPERVRRVAGRFSAKVMLPDRLRLVFSEAPGDGVGFEILNADGARAVAAGYLQYA